MGKEDTSRRWFSFRARLIDICSSPQVIPNDSGRVSPRDILLRLLNLGSGDIEHPQLGKIRVKVRGGRTRHYNISFSKSPVYCEGWSARRVIEEYGYADSSGHKKALRIRVGIADVNQSEKLGLKVQDDFVNIVSGIETIASWRMKELIERFHDLSKLLVVDYTISKSNNREEISYSNPKLAFLNVGLLESEFQDLIRSGKISPEFRMFIGEAHEHCESRGIKTGSLRDHGFGWRLKAPEEDGLYSTVNIVGDYQ
jgi:hypothetical protein